MFIRHKSVRNIMSKHLMVRFSILALCVGQKSHFEHILNDYIENGPSLTKIYRFFEAKIITLIFSKNFRNETFNFSQNLNC